MSIYTILYVLCVLCYIGSVIGMSILIVRVKTGLKYGL